MEIKLKTLTPIWTGGVEAGKMDRLHETGILGSLRWWYEAIVRGLGGSACDPTGHSCIYDPKKPNNGLCDVCQVFGATGWRRRFRLEVEDETEPIWEPADRILNIRPPRRNRGWFLPPGKMGEVTLKFTGDPKTLPLMAVLLLFLEKWGNLGAKPQLGYGVFQIENHHEVKESAGGWKWETLGNEKPNGKLPDLRQFGFFRYRFQPDTPGWWTQVPGIERVATKVRPLVPLRVKGHEYSTVPVAPALKNEWRFHRWQTAWGDARKFFGALHPDRIRSKAAVSWAYKIENAWEVRGYVALQGLRQPQAAWEMFRDQDVWSQVIGVSGILDTHPGDVWQTWSAEEAQQFLEGIQ